VIKGLSYILVTAQAREERYQKREKMWIPAPVIPPPLKKPGSSFITKLG
jgi:hypothetical protein